MLKNTPTECPTQAASIAVLSTQHNPVPESPVHLLPTL